MVYSERNRIGGNMTGANVGTSLDVEQEKSGRSALQGSVMEISISRQDLLRELTATQSEIGRAHV